MYYIALCKTINYVVKHKLETPLFQCVNVRHNVEYQI